MSVTYKKELGVYKKIWAQTRAILRGGHFIRELAKNDESVFPFSSELKELDLVVWTKRRNELIDGATFFPVASNTLAGYCGQAFSRPYIITLPTNLKSMEKDIDGAGTSLEQQLKAVFNYTMGFNFCGILIDFFKPEGTTQVNAAELESRKAGAVFKVIDPDDILDWAYDTIEGRKVLVYLKLRFFDETIKDLANFDVEALIQKDVRILDIRLIGGNVWYVSRKLRDGKWEVSPLTEFRNAKDANLGKIPFTFVGSDTNEGELEVGEFYKLVDLNLAHFRSSADFDEASSVAGQGTIVLSGITEDWNREVLKEKIAFGVRKYIPLNEGASASMLQLNPNLLSFEAMKHKENQMVAIGARLSERTNNDLEKTATEINSSDNNKGSVLSNCVNNINSAYLWAFSVACEFVGAEFSQVEFKMNFNFNVEKLTLEERRQLIAEWQAKLLTIEETREALKDAGNSIATLEEFMKDFESGESFKFINATNEEKQNETEAQNK